MRLRLKKTGGIRELLYEIKLIKNIYAEAYREIPRKETVENLPMSSIYKEKR
mgnify:CR=1 FL=1